MSTRALGAVALVLLALLAATAYLGARRLGYLDPPEPVTWRFENATLTAKPKQIVLVAPMEAEGPHQQLWLDHVDADPQADDPDVPFPEPYLVVGVAERRADEETYSRLPEPGFFVLRRLGARSPTERLAEIRPVREVREEGDRLVLRATFFGIRGQKAHYYFDPEAPVGFVGWYRREEVVANEPQAVHFASVSPPAPE